MQSQLFTTHNHYTTATLHSTLQQLWYASIPHYCTTTTMTNFDLYVNTLSLYYNAFITLQCTQSQICGLDTTTSSSYYYTTTTLHFTQWQFWSASKHNSSMHTSTTVGCISQHQALTTAKLLLSTPYYNSFGLYITTMSLYYNATNIPHSTRSQLWAVYHIIKITSQHNCYSWLNTTTALGCILRHWAYVTMQPQLCTAYHYSCQLYITTTT